MKRVRTVKPKSYEEKVSVCDICCAEDGEDYARVNFYTPYDLSGITADYPYERYLDLCEKCKPVFAERYGPRIWAVMDEVIDEIKGVTPKEDK